MASPELWSRRGTVIDRLVIFVTLFLEGLALSLEENRTDLFVRLISANTFKYTE